MKKEETKLQSISFEPVLCKEIEKYAKWRNISFSRATTELASAGVGLLNELGTINAASIKEKISGLEKEVSLLKEWKEKMPWGKSLKVMVQEEMERILKEKKKLKEGTQILDSKWEGGEIEIEFARKKEEARQQLIREGLLPNGKEEEEMDKGCKKEVKKEEK